MLVVQYSCDFRDDIAACGSGCLATLMRQVVQSTPPPGQCNAMHRNTVSHAAYQYCIQRALVDHHIKRATSKLGHVANVHLAPIHIILGIATHHLPYHNGADIDIDNVLVASIVHVHTQCCISTQCGQRTASTTTRSCVVWITNTYSSCHSRPSRCGAIVRHVVIAAIANSRIRGTTHALTQRHYACRMHPNTRACQNPSNRQPSRNKVAVAAAAI
jgi:hypothetical protein